MAELGLMVTDATVLRAVVDAIWELTDEGGITFRPEGIYVREFDKMKASFLDMFIPANKFSAYNCTEERYVRFDIDMLSKFVKKSNMPLSIKFENNQLIISSISEAVIKRLTMPTIFGEAIAPRDVNLKGEVKFRTKVEVIQSLLNDIVEISPNRVTIISNSDKMQFLGTGDDGITKLESSIPTQALGIFTYEGAGSTKVTYNAELLASGLIALSLFDIVDVTFSTDEPIKLVGYETKSLGVKASYILAPIIEQT